MVATFAEWIRAVRGSMSQSDFAAHIAQQRPSGGIHPETVSRWERGVAVPPDWRILAIMDCCAIREVERDYVFALARRDRIALRGAAPQGAQ